ncbi:hypothetical protein GF361_03565 [Candidatus Woesearchaeota archaeon]|nr:hypothetical protein [Candidatus Woesearchaeota archaeon]
MQTFLPYPNIRKSLKALDSRRLGKQRVEAYQILNIILKRTKSSGWKNHPAVKMWKKHPNALKFYLNTAIKEWISRGYKNTMSLEIIRGKVVFPIWLGNKKFHSSHKSNLLKKAPEFYKKLNWNVPSSLPYIWPKD